MPIGTHMGAGRGNQATFNPPLAEMQSMDDYQFEHFVASVWENHGFRTSHDTIERHGSRRPGCQG